MLGLKSVKLLCLAVLFITCYLLLVTNCFAQATETLTITTYYPSPAGSYKDLSIYNTLTFKDPAGGSAQLVGTVDASGNLHLSSNISGFQIIFDKVTEDGVTVNRPYCYLRHFDSTSGTVYCANGYVAANFLKDDMTPVDPASLPTSGYYVCVRGSQTF